ncbi:MAG: hypothetical protein ABIB71_02105 [Candidatus Woesearchaeota archaeon]
MKIGNNGNLEEVYSFLKPYLLSKEIKVGRISRRFKSRLLLPGINQICLSFRLYQEGEIGQVKLEKKGICWKKKTLVTLTDMEEVTEKIVHDGLCMYASHNSYKLEWKILIPEK